METSDHFYMWNIRPMITHRELKLLNMIKNESYEHVENFPSKYIFIELKQKLFHALIEYLWL